MCYADKPKSADLYARLLKEIMSRQILNGWKEISRHIDRSVRTVQRWEIQLGLPVYRPALRDRSAVMAFSDELEGWIRHSEVAAPHIEEDDESALFVCGLS